MTYEMKFFYKDAFATLVVWEDAPTGTVTNVYSTYRGRGLATEVMRRLVSVADSMKLDLLLEVAPYGEDPKLDSSALETFYGKFGFVKNNPNRDVMERPSPTKM